MDLVLATENRPLESGWGKTGEAHLEANGNSLCQRLLLQGEGWSRTRTKGEGNGPKGRTEQDGEGKMVSVAGSK